MPKYIVLIGPPGAGKGTQAALIAKQLGLAHISSGNIFRENIDNKTELGLKAKRFIDSGGLVPDDLTIAMIRERLAQPDCKKGAILDGFPRTAAQAKALEQMLETLDGKIDCVPLINVPDDVLIKRLSGRWICEKEGHVYQLQFSPPKKTGICDIDGSPLYQRSDDKQETVENRIRVYTEQTAPLIEYYRKTGLLHEVDGTQEINKISNQIVHLIQQAD